MKTQFNITNAVINGEEQPAVNARELWSALEVKRQFTDWIKDRLVDFEEGPDYLFHKIVKQHPSGKKYMNEYFLTLDTAKHLAMLERNEIGKKIRQYFIEFEKEARKALECHCHPTANREDLAASTVELLNKLNCQLIAGMDVDKDVLRYAWNIGKLMEKPVRRIAGTTSPLEDYIWSIQAGAYTRHEIYKEYCKSCRSPLSARMFWPRVREIRPCSEKRQCNCRLVVFE